MRRVGGAQRRRRSLSRAPAWPLLAVLCVAPVIEGQEATSPVREGEPAAPQEEARELEVQRARVERLQEELERLAGRRDDVVKAFEAADVELALRRQQLRLLQRRRELLAQNEVEQVATVQRLEEALADTRRQLRRRAVTLYRIGPLSYNRLLLSADSTDDVLAGYQLVTYLAARDRDLAASARRELRELEVARVQLRQTQERLGELVAEAEAATEALEIQQQERRRALVRLDQEAEAQRSALDEAERAARALAATLEDLEGAVEPGAGARFVAARGDLPWPVEGPVVGGWGRRRHPVYDTYTISRGIEIGAEHGDPVRAVHPGTVVFADWYSGYGILVIVDHGDEYFTLYGHLSEVVAQVNDRVDAGEIIARVGETASLTGPNLYFEVREGSYALNPSEWLRERP